MCVSGFHCFVPGLLQCWRDVERLFIFLPGSFLSFRAVEVGVVFENM